MSYSLYKLKSHILFTGKIFVFSYFTQKKIMPQKMVEASSSCAPTPHLLVPTVPYADGCCINA